MDAPQGLGGLGSGVAVAWVERHREAARERRDRHAVPRGDELRVEPRPRPRGTRFEELGAPLLEDRQELEVAPTPPREDVRALEIARRRRAEERRERGAVRFPRDPPELLG